MEDLAKSLDIAVIRSHDRSMNVLSEDDIKKLL